jgi:hypothetical protein
VCLPIFTTISLCDDASGDDTKGARGRYQIYVTPSQIMMLLDTKTGKIWKISADGSGTMKAEGITVEGLAYSTSAIDIFNNKIKDINLDGVSDKNKKECRDNLVSVFSYTLDAEKINDVLKYYKDIAQ